GRCRGGVGRGGGGRVGGRGGAGRPVSDDRDRRCDHLAAARPIVRPSGDGGTAAVSHHECQLMNNRILVLGGGVAGSSIAYYLSEKGYDVTVVERNTTVGGLARTCTYTGHPYQVRPHILFWPGGGEE